MKFISLITILIFSSSVQAGLQCSQLFRQGAFPETLDMSLRGFSFLYRNPAVMAERDRLAPRIISGVRDPELERQYFERLDANASTAFLKNYMRLLRERPDWERLPSAINRGQMSSKHWLVESFGSVQKQILEYLKTDQIESAMLVGGWFGTLAELFFNRNPLLIAKFKSVDIDPEATGVALRLNSENVIAGKFEAITVDAMKIKYSEESLIFNTSVEHFPDFAGWYNLIPGGKVVVLQSNDYFKEPEHCNCSASLAEFEAQAPMRKVFFRGELPVYTDHTRTKLKYKRFLLIGIK